MPDDSKAPDAQQETRNESVIKPKTPQGRTDDAPDGPSTGSLDDEGGASEPADE